MASLLFLYTGPTAQAATLNTLNFQARLQTNPGGAIVADGYYNIEFKLYDTSSSSGSSQGSCTGDVHCLWTETYINLDRVRVAHGYLTVNLGSLTTLPAINWDQDLYITMNVGGTSTPSWNGEMSPRLKLGAVPYAFKASQLAQYNGTTGFTSKLSLTSPTGGNQNFVLPDMAAAGTYTLLNTVNGIQNSTPIQTNASIAISSAADANITALFAGRTSQSAAVLQLKAGSSQTGDSLQVTDSSTLALAGFSSAGQLYLGRASGATGSLKLLNSTNANTVTVQSGVTAGSYSLTLPTAIASTGQCLAAGTVSGGNVPLTFGSCGGSTGYVNGGNSFGAPAILGSTDGNSLQFIINTVPVQTFGTAQNIAYFGNADNTGQASSPTDFTIQGTSSSSTSFVGGKLTLKGGNGTSSSFGSTGGEVAVIGGSAQGTGTRNGGQVTITGGTPNASGVGGAVAITTGAGGTTTGGSGALTVKTGDATGTSSTAGNLTLDVGTSTAGGPVINIGNSTNSPLKTITIGGTTQSGGITIGQSTVSNNITIGNGAVTGTQTIAIGTGATGSGVETISLGSTLNTSGTTISGGSNGIKLNTNSTSTGTIVRSATNDSTGAFQVQNAAGDSVINVDTSQYVFRPNYISNYSFEQNATGWTAIGGTASRTVAAGNAYHLNSYLDVATSASGNGVRVSGFTSTPTYNGLAWNFSAYLAVTSSMSSSLLMGYDTGSGDTACTPNVTSISVSAGYVRVNCAITLTVGQTISSLYIKQSDAVSRSILVDAAQLTNAGPNAYVFLPATIQLNGVIANPVTIKTAGNAGDAFTIYNSNGQSVQLAVNPTTGVIAFGTGTSLTYNNGTTFLSNVSGGPGLSNLTGFAQASGTAQSDVSTFTVNASTSTLFKKTGVGVATAFQIQDGSSNPLFTVDTSSSQVVLGKVGPTGGFTGKLTVANSANAFTASLTASTSASASYTLTLPTALSGVTGDCLKDTNGSGQLGFANCGSGLSGFGTIDSVSKDSTKGASVSGNSIILQSADASNPGLVTFSGTQIFGGNKTFTGDTLVKTTSATALQVQDSGATTNIITADTTNSKLSLGTVGSNSVVQLTGIAGGAGSLQAFATNAQSIGGNRVGSSTVTNNGYMYVMGGYDGTTYQTTTYYAKMNADGSTGAFTATAALPAGRAFGSAVVGNNGYVYYMGGTANGTAAQATVYYSKIQSDGTLGAWATDTGHPITNVRMGATSITANGYLYVIGGYDGTTYQATTYYAKMAGDGTLGTWASTTSFAAGRAYHSSVVVNGFVYVIGGTANGTAGNNTVYYAQINAAGTLNAWSTEATNTLPAVRMGATSVVANGYTYVLGGSTNNTTGAVNTVYYSKFNADGSVGTWGTNTNNLINTSYQHSSVVSNGYVYIIAGWDGTTRRAAVYYASGARLQVAASLDLIGSTQTDGMGEEQGNGSFDGSGSVGGSIAAGNIFSNGNVQVTGGVQVAGALVLGSTISGAGLTDCSDITSKLLWSADTQQFSCGNDRGSTLVWKPTTQTNSIALLTDDTALQFAIAANEQWIFEIDAGVGTVGSADAMQFAVTGPSGVGCAMDGISSDNGGTVTVTTFATFGCAATQVANIGSDGQLNISGVVAAGATAGTIKFRFGPTASSNTASVNVGSTLRAYRVTGADYAENYFTKDYSLTPGNVVSVDGSVTAGVQKASQAYQHDIIGVVSTEPGQVIGDSAGIKQGRPVPVALNGRVPVKVASDSPAIKAGDLITSSSTQPGRAMKATRAGEIIGKALLDWTPGTSQDTVLIFMGVGWGDPESGLASDDNVASGQDLGGTSGNLQAGSDIAVADITASNITISGNGTVQGDLTVSHNLNTYDLHLSGHVSTSGTAPTFEILASAGATDAIISALHKAKVEISGNDTSGTLKVTIGDLPAGLEPGDLVKVVFDRDFGHTPRVIVGAQGKASARLQPYVADVDKGFFVIAIDQLPQAGATYTFNYYAVE